MTDEITAEEFREGPDAARELDVPATLTGDSE